MKSKSILFLFLCIAFMNAFQIRVFCEETGSFDDFDDNQAYAAEAEYGSAEPVYFRGKVLNSLEVAENEYDQIGFTANVQHLEVIIMEGPFKGETVSAEYALNYGFDDKYIADLLSVGDEVFLFLAEDESGGIAMAYVAEIARDKYLYCLAAGFILILLLIGRLKGLKAVVSLALTIFAIFKILLPAILNGFSPILASVLTCVGVIVVTLLIIGGLNVKTISAILGTSGGVMAAGIIALVIGSLAKLTGLSTNEAQMLMYIPQDIYFDFKGLLFSGILIGAMGATMDVGMSISSAMYELKQNDPLISAANLLKAGMNVGRDSMATMSNTLILAYTGSSMQLILLFMAYRYPLSVLINWDMIASEILKALAGSIGIIVAIPITAVSSTFIYNSSFIASLRSQDKLSE